MAKTRVYRQLLTKGRRSQRLVRKNKDDGVCTKASEKEIIYTGL